MKVVEYHDERPNIRAGSIITAYHAGYHKVTELHERDDGCKLVSYVKVLTSAGKSARNKKPFTCHILYCELVDPQKILDEELKLAHEKYDSLVNLIK